MAFASAEEVAKAGISAFKKRRSYYIPGLMNYLTSLLPMIMSRAAAIRIAANMFKGRVAPFEIK